MILEAIFNGEIYPAETVVPKCDKFRQATKMVSDTMSYFEAQLTKENYQLLEKLQDHLADAQIIENEEQFKYGFTIGVLMMCEIYGSPYIRKTE